MCVCVCVYMSGGLPLVHRVDHHGVVAGRDGDKGEWPSHQLVVVLQNQILRSNLQHRNVCVLSVCVCVCVCERERERETKRERQVFIPGSRIVESEAQSSVQKTLAVHIQ